MKYYSTMRKVPPVALQRTLLETLLRTMPGHAAKEKALLKFFFSRSIRGHASHITVPQILEDCEDGPKSENAIYNAIGRVKEALQVYFDRNRLEPIRVGLEPNSHTLLFARNRLPCPRVSKFWEPYFLSFATTLLYYPEPQFFRHRNGTYIRHPHANWRDQKTNILRLLRIDDRDLIPSYSFVPSGLAAAMASLFACFHANNADLCARPLNPTQTLPEDGANAIVLGSPTTSLNLISSLERDSGMRTAREKDQSVFYVPNSKTGAEESHVDEIQEERDFKKTAQSLTKWAVVTRCIESQNVQNGAPISRVITVLAGHSRSVQAVTEFLTSEEKIKPLSTKLSRRPPKAFQAFFEVKMDKFYGELEKATASFLTTRIVDHGSSHQRVAKASAGT